MTDRSPGERTVEGAETAAAAAGAAVGTAAGPHATHAGRRALPWSGSAWTPWTPSAAWTVPSYLDELVDDSMREVGHVPLAFVTADMVGARRAPREHGPAG